MMLPAKRDGKQTDWRNLVVGASAEVPVLGAGRKPYINLDNAASTPPLRAVMETVAEFAPCYSSVHRGTGYKSQLSTFAYEEARRMVGLFVGADPVEDVVIFCKHTTEALNLVADLLKTGPGDVVLTSEMEHHSNLLPWRKHHLVDYVRVDSRGRLDEDELRAKLLQHAGRVKLVAITGASNVTGFLPELRGIAEMAHSVGALLLVDAAQLAAHRKLDMRPHTDPAHIDFVAMSAHKMYAPFGAGALVGPRTFFKEAQPMLVGGGTVKFVTLEETLWDEPPDRDEGGSPNVLGAIALATACSTLTEIGMDRIAIHERALTRYLLERLGGLDGIKLLGCRDVSLDEDRLGVVAFNVDGIPHNLVAAVLGYEYAIGVRAGCFCAHPYVFRLLGVDEEAARRHRVAMTQGDRSSLPGAVRVSLGLYNVQDDIDSFIEALSRIMAGNIRGRYVVERSTGEYRPEGTIFDLKGHLPEAMKAHHLSAR